MIQDKIECVECQYYNPKECFCDAIGGCVKYSASVDEPEKQRRWIDNREMIILNGEQIDELVRCRDCKWYKEGKYFAHTRFCFRLKDEKGEEIGYNFASDDFCSYGERKDEVKE